MLAAVLVLGVAVGIVDAHAEDFSRIGNRNLQTDVAEGIIGGASGKLLGHACFLSGDERTEIWKLRAQLLAEVNDLVALDQSIAGAFLDFKADVAHCLFSN